MLIQITPTLEAAAAPPPESRPRLSPSQVNRLMQCPASWWYRYALRLPEPTSIWLAIGTAVHAGIAAALNPLYDAESTMQEFRLRFAMETEPIVMPPADRAAYEARAAAYLDTWITSAAPRPGDHRTEAPLTGTIAGVPVAAKADIITADAAIEVKTRSSKPDGLPAGYYLQAVTYALLAELPHARVDILHGSRKIGITHHTVDADTRAADYAATMYTAAADQIQAGLFPPRRDGEYCSRSYCPHWFRCERDHGGIVRG